ALVRYNSDGSLDRDFGLEGMVVTPVGDSDDEITGVTLQEDGRILLTGTALGEQGRVVVLARYQSDGNPDQSFAEEGFALSAVGMDARAESLLLTEEGRILVSGTYREKDNAALMVLGYDENGDLDTSFGYKGVTVPLDGTVASAGYGMAERSDGSILVAGSVGESGKRDGALFLFGEDGLPDREFGDLGVLVTDDESDTVFYDVLVTKKMVATTGVTVGEDGKRESLLVTYSKNEIANRQLFQQQVAQRALIPTNAASSMDEEEEETEPVAQVVTSEVDNEEDSAFSLAAVDEGSVVVVGSSGAPEISSASVRQYTVFQSSVTGTSSNTTTGNASILTGDAYNVTRTTALIPVEVLSGIGTVTARGVVFSVDPLPVLDDDDSDTTTDDTSDDSTDDTSDDSTDDTTDDTTDDSTDTTTTDETAPTITSTTSSSFTDTEDVILSVTTNEVSYCGYSKDYSTSIASYDDMPTTDGITHKVTLSDTFVAGSTYTYYVGCQDESDNVSKFPAEIQFNVVTASLYKNSIFYIENQLASTSPLQSGRLASALEGMGNLFVSTAYAEDDTTDSTTTP
ncbi:MAG: hypothetical protein D3908_09180, partial [Candidatus Electrothrix sp. AUS4]|nr:hypothetical protein [Candidatus Electrothrix sp. AUS4]